MTNNDIDLLEGKVAGVLTERELIINIGSNHGVTLDMRFKVLANAPTEVRDPETNEILGMVDREKVRVQVAELQEKFTVCRTYRVHYTGGYFTRSITEQMGWDRLLGPRKEVPETLKAKDSSVFPPLSEEESYVKKGDRVIQLRTDDD